VDGPEFRIFRAGAHIGTNRVSAVPGVASRRQPLGRCDPLWTDVQDAVRPAHPQCRAAPVPFPPHLPL